MITNWTVTAHLNVIHVVTTFLIEQLVDNTLQAHRHQHGRFTVNGDPLEAILWHQILKGQLHTADICICGRRGR
jgi:hypothetical protein